MSNKDLRRKVKWIFIDFNKVLAEEVGSVKLKANELMGITMEEYNSVSWPVKAKLLEKYHQIKTTKEQKAYFVDFYTEIMGHLEINHRVSPEELAELQFNREFKLKKNTLEYLKTLSKKYKLGSISNSFPTRREDFKKLGIEEYFDLLVLSMEEGISKPNVDLFKLSAIRAGVFPEEAVHVDDKFEILSEALKAGYSRGYLYAGYYATEFKEYKHIPNVKVAVSLEDVVTDLC